METRPKLWESDSIPYIIFVWTDGMSVPSCYHYCCLALELLSRSVLAVEIARRSGGERTFASGIPECILVSMERKPKVCPCCVAVSVGGRWMLV